jgi:hypothetical protein
VGVFSEALPVNKLAKRDGVVVKTKDVLANNDREAMQVAREDDDCPVCDVLQGRQEGRLDRLIGVTGRSTATKIS